MTSSNTHSYRLAPGMVPWLCGAALLALCTCGRIDYDPLSDPDGGGMLPPPIEISLRIARDNSDAWDDQVEGSLALSTFGDQSFQDAAAFQWPLPVPHRARIVSATLELRSQLHQGETASYTVLIHAEDVPNALPLLGRPNDIFGRRYLPMTVPWLIPEGGLPINQPVPSPDIAPLVQAIVDRPGWEVGNHLGLALWSDTPVGGANEVITDFSDDPDAAALLRIRFRPPPPPPPAP